MKEATQKSLDALSKGINAELAAYIFYKRAGERVKHKELARLMERLAGEEKDHYQTLEGEYDSLVRSEKWVTYNDIMRQKELPEIPEEMAETHRRKLSLLEKTDDPHKILEIAIGLEEEARDFYSSRVTAETDPSAIEIYSYLSKFEQGHINVLTTWSRKF
jgi:rubrerythrin